MSKSFCLCIQYCVELHYIPIGKKLFKSKSYRKILFSNFSRRYFFTIRFKEKSGFLLC